MLSVATFAQRESGYRGFFDAGYVISATKIGDADVSNRISATTSHGYQINETFFAGAGAGFQYFHQGEAYTIPVFGDLRADISKFFVDAKIGYSLGDWEGFYLNPAVGYRFPLGEKLGLNISAGYLLQTLSGVDGTSGDITLHIGIDF